MLQIFSCMFLSFKPPCKNKKPYLFADDRNITATTMSAQTLPKKNKLNDDLKSVCRWLRANKSSLTVQKTDFVLFQSPQSKANDGRWLIPTRTVIYLEIFYNQHLISCPVKYRRDNATN